MAEPIIFAPRNALSLAARVADRLGIPLAPSEERAFDRGEHKMRPLINVRNRDVFVIVRLAGGHGLSVNDDLCRLLFFAGALKDAGARHITVCAPYLPYARKDRRTQTADPVTSRYVASLMECMGIARVMVVGVHNDAALDNGFRCETIRLDAGPAVVDEIAGILDTDQPPVIVSPDAGGMTRAERFREAFHERQAIDAEVTFIRKTRSRGSIGGEAILGNLANRNVIIVDDMIASGETALRATRAARHAGAGRVHLFATHAVFTADASRLLAAEGPDSIWITDTVDIPSDFPTEKLRRVSIAPLLASVIMRLHAGESIAGLSLTG